MKLPVALDARAGAELREYQARLAAVNPASARALAHALAGMLDLIAEFPELHELYGGNLRRAVLKRWFLGIFYEPMPDLIFVAAILDLRRDPAAIHDSLDYMKNLQPLLRNPP